MKDFIQNFFPERMNSDELGVAVTEAWEAVPAGRIVSLVCEMPESCQAVRDANGGHVRF